MDHDQMFKFVNIVGLEGLLQQCKIAEDYISRDLKYIKIIQDEKPSWNEWVSNISYEGDRYSYPQRSIARDQGIMFQNIIKSKEIISMKKEKIREKCKLLGLNFEEIMRTKQVPLCHSLEGLPEYMEFKGEPMRKRRCVDAFGKKYSDTRLHYYS